MRTSLSEQIQGSLMYLEAASRNLLQAQDRAATGKRILKPSDDVLGTSQALNLRSSINTVEQFTNNIVVSKPILDASERALDDLVKAVRSVRDIAIGAGNPSCTDTALKAYAGQLDDILAQMADVGNTKHMDQYVFSGTATDKPPLLEQAGAQPFSYQGNSGVRRGQVLSWVSVSLNIPGDRVFNFDGSAGAGSTDLFTMVKQLRDSVEAGDIKSVSSQLANVDANLDNLLTCSAQVGSWISRLESAQQTLVDSSDRLKQMLSDTEDIDLPQAIVDLKTQENVYQTALSISGRMLDLSLASMRFTQ